MNFIRSSHCFGPMLLLAALTLPPISAAQQQPATTQQASTETILKPADLTGKMPAEVFFRGQSATVQLRNSGGVRYTDGMLTLVGLVDTSGYSSGIQQKYQAYLLTEVTLIMDGHRLPPGAYGVGFVAGDRFVVMDIGEHDLFSAKSIRDDTLHRPTPMQVLAAPEAHQYRLYAGRAYTTFMRAAHE
ncbi:MAG: hypothetical protein ACR2JE_14515 [Acidobacteriaceae bacterium]